MTTPEARLAAAIFKAWPRGANLLNDEDAAAIIAADPTIAADLNDAPRLRAALDEIRQRALLAYAANQDLDAKGIGELAQEALTEGSGE